MIKFYNFGWSDGIIDYLIQKAATEIESNAADFYYELINKGIEEEVISSTCDTKFLSYFLDNQIIILQYTFACEYYKERLKISVGDPLKSKDELIKYTLNTILTVCSNQ